VGKKVHKPISYPSPFRPAREKKSIVYNNTFRFIDQGSMLDGKADGIALKLIPSKACLLGLLGA
jgi:hypothetical protein